MGKRDFQKTLDRARRELEQEMYRRDRAETRIAQLTRVIASVSGCMEPMPERPFLATGKASLKGAVRTALRAIGKTATATDVRMVLRELRFPIEKHTNPIGSIHTVLTRLVADGE